MTTLQEYLNQKYPTKERKQEVSSIDFSMKREKLEVGDLDLSEYENLATLAVPLMSFNPSRLTLNNPYLQYIRINSQHAGLFFSSFNCPNLTKLELSGNNLTSIDFLNRLPNPDKLEELYISNNKIQSTDISIFSKFINLKELRIGTTNPLQEERNHFYGSFESWKDLNKLEAICIEATDVDRGLEYLPFNLAKSISEEVKREKYEYEPSGGYKKIECSPYNTNAKCSQIQNQLRPYDYDLEAWQLAHPHLMYKAKPEFFFNPEVKSKWLSALRDKLANTQSKLNDIKQNNPNETKKISRLELKLDNLKLIQKDISNNQLIERLQQKELVKKEDKTTQTELVLEVKK